MHEHESFWRSLGLDPADVLVYRRLLAEGGTATHATAAGDLSPVRVRRSVDRLVDLGLVERHGRSLRARRPSTSVLAATQARRSALGLAEVVAEEMDRMWTAAAPSTPGAEAFEVLRGVDLVQQRLRDLVAGAETSICVIDTPPYVSAPDPALHALERAAMARGVRMRTLVAFEALEEKLHAADILRAVDEGGLVRMSHRLHTKLLVFDDAQALIPLAVGGSPASRPQVAVISARAIVVALREYFDAIFDGAAPLDPAPGPPHESHGSAVPDDPELVQLLSAGFTDQVVAHRLGISDRTLRRRIQRLMDRYEANGRFQLGRRIEQTNRDALDTTGVPETGNGGR